MLLKTVLFITSMILFVDYPELLANHSPNSGLQEENNQNTPTLHAFLIIVDDYIDADNNGISESVKKDYGTVSTFLERLTDRNIVNLNKKVLMGKNTSKYQVLDLLSNISAGENDILFFYFSGHGGLIEGTKNVMFTREGNYIERSEIEDIFSTVSARFKVVISDACSNSIDGVPVFRRFETHGSYDGRFDDIYKELLYNYKGLLSVSASSPGEYAWSDDYDGGYFTHNFFKELLITKPNSEWSKMFETSKNKTMQMFRLISAEERQRLLSEEGIANQTPIAYSLPQKSTASNTVNNNISEITNNTNNNVVSNNTTNTDIIKNEIKNNTNQTIVFALDYNADINNWKEELYKEEEIYAGQTMNVSNEVVISFNNGKENYYYILDGGTFYFSDDGYTFNLFIDEIGAEEKTDFNENLIGKWKWELADAIFNISFLDDNTYSITDTNSEIIEWGNWNITVDTNNNSLLSFSIENEESTDRYTYQINVFDTETLQLIIKEAEIAGEYYSAQDFNEEDSNIMIYKTDK